MRRRPNSTETVDRPSKIEIWLSSPHRLAACSFDLIVVDGSAIQPSLSPGSRRHHRSSHQSRWSRQPADKDMLFSYSSASLDSSISDYPLLPCPSSCNGLILTWLFQQTPQRSFEVPSRSVVRCHEGRHMPRPRASSEKPHYWRDLRETVRARHSRTSRLQTLCAGFLVSAQVCTSLYNRLFHPGCGKGRPSLRSAATSRWLFHAPRLWQSAHGHSQLDLGLLGTISQSIFVIQSRYF